MCQIIPFRPRDIRSDAQKYAEAVADQTGNRQDLGVIPCPFCEGLLCNFDCDEAQADGFND